MPTRRWDARAPAIAAVAIAVLYGVLGLAVFGPDAVYSGDIGVKFVQTRAVAASRFTSLDLPYPGEFLDPAREFFPIRPPFVLTVGGETQAIYSPASVVLQTGFAGLAGMRGLIALSFISAAVILFACSRMAVAGQKMAVVIALGLASPLWFYAVLGWEHAPAVAFSTAGFAVALASRKGWTCVLAGLLVGSGALVREEVILLTPGLLLIIALRHRSVYAVAVTCAATIVPVVCGLGMDVLVGRPPAAHLRHAVYLVPAVNATETHVVTPFTLRERYQTVIQYWLLGYGNDRWIVAFSSALFVVLAARWRFPGRAGTIPLLLWVIAVVALAAIDLREVMTAPKWIAGLHRLSPYLVFVLLPPPTTGERGPWYHRGLLTTAAVYILLAFVGTNFTGGKSLGPRLLLPLLPLLAVAAMARMVAYLRARAAVDRAIGLAGTVLVMMSIALHVTGTMPAYYVRSREDTSTLQTARAADARVIVADDPFTAQLLFPLYYRKVIFLADSAPLRAKLGTLLADAKVPEVLLISRGPEPGMRLSPLKLRQSDRVGRMYIQYWGRIGRERN